MKTETMETLISAVDLLMEGDQSEKQLAMHIIDFIKSKLGKAKSEMSTV